MLNITIAKTVTVFSDGIVSIEFFVDDDTPAKGVGWFITAEDEAIGKRLDIADNLDYCIDPNIAGNANGIWIVNDGSEMHVDLLTFRLFSPGDCEDFKYLHVYNLHDECFHDVSLKIRNRTLSEWEL